MKHRSLLLALPLMLLGACSAQSSGSVTLDDNLKNPLFAHRYYIDLVDEMVNFQLNNDPVIKDAGKRSAIDDARIQGTKHAQETALLNQKGQRGTIQSEKERTAGSVLLLGNTLFFGTDFITSPGPSLHVYLTTVVDPRQSHFPDATAIDLGPVQNPYGAQAFLLPKTDKPVTYRSVGIWDDALGTFWGFAQLQGGN